MNIYLDYYKAVREHKIVNRESFYAKYGSRPGHKMLQGTPLVINIEGTYIKVDDLVDLITNRSLVPIVLKWMIATKQPILSNPPFTRFRWRREWTK